MEMRSKNGDESDNPESVQWKQRRRRIPTEIWDEEGKGGNNKKGRKMHGSKGKKTVIMKKKKKKDKLNHFVSL